MLCPSLLSSQNIDPEESLSSQQFDRSYLVERIWDQIYETHKKRKSGLTDNDCRYFDRLLTAIEEWSQEELLELADATPSEFRKEFRGW
ncbi:hypothetical protein ABVY47_003106 [Vibrio parahaemolyticus]|uniref:hypothetical protein n=1 Tax=Vibrio parahaemolyticus TaxID=670 RepID=UPI00165669B7|nr:hypothetical protein [Vibrio parahaemolyticus]EGQ8957453.1 hypothetical protein [Vibrio parahaemolyticus]EGR3230298.1 hypothetical protein [Vibrio parahaemolyticus]EIU6783711.1 hypothetical protein [Vibrio parahaemolyticus]EJC6792815.1 hypothetical protein [Vibrio parahaemolyticus]EJC6849386.1 hypothetical protein [Vibrio parahaemolyticus]